MAQKRNSAPLEVKRALERVRRALERDGLLMCHDAELTSATAIIAGEPIRGTWWSHPRGALIYEVLEALEGEVATPKLVRGKLTLLHRRLWPSLFVTATCGEIWQTRALEDDARWLLQQISREQSIRSDHLDPPPGSRKMGAIVTDLEQRLLVSTRSEHTEGGHHARFVETWQTWRDRIHWGRKPLPTLAQALELLTEPIRKLNDHSKPSTRSKPSTLKGWVPWVT